MSVVKCQLSNVRRGFALIAITIISAILLLTSTYFISLSMTDLRIARAQTATVRAYYLGETGSALLIAELQTNSTLSQRFVNGTLSQANSTITRTNIFTQGDSISAYAISSAKGEATIYTESNNALGVSTAERHIANQISRALGGSITDYSMMTGGTNQDIRLGLDANFTGGIVFSNDDIKIQNGASVTVDGDVWAHDDVEIRSGSTLTVVNGKIRDNRPTLDMPAMDFDSASPNSWRNRATSIMTPSQFNALPSGSTLTGIIFVNGSPADLKKTLTVQGALVINGSFEIETPANLRILQNGTAPSGLFVQNSLEIEHDTYVEGLVYVSNNLEVEYDDDDTTGTLDVTIRGGIIARSLIFSRDASGPVAINIIHDETLIEQVLDTQFDTAPLIDVGHWEEQY